MHFGNLNWGREKFKRNFSIFRLTNGKFCDLGNEKIVNALLRHSANVNITNSDGSALYQAAKNGN